MKSLSLFCILFWVLTGFKPSHDSLVQRLIVLPSSTLYIDGTTNVSKFECKIEKYIGTDTLMMTIVDGKKAVFQQGILRLAAASFDCGPKLITRDFQKTLKTDQFPHIVIEFVSFERPPDMDAARDSFIGIMKITLANATVTCEIRCNTIRDDKKQLHLLGGRNFNFSDFGLKPPVKMAGAVKVRDQLAVNFHLILQQL